MADFDIALIRIWNFARMGILINDRVEVLVIRASGDLEVLSQGKKHFTDTSPASQASMREFAELESSFVSDGWRPLDSHSGGRTGFFIKDTVIPPAKVSPISDRLKIIDELLRTKKLDEGAARGFQSALMQLESLADPDPAPVRAELVELLERLTELHRSGKLSDEQFEEAKNRALGL